MTATPPTLDASFLANQRARLLALRTDLAHSRQGAAEEADEVLAEGQNQANEIEDQAQDLEIADNDRGLASQLERQRTAIDRALTKLDEGTYGLSDISGLPIPIARLRAYPQAVGTIAEEAGIPGD